MSDQTFIPMSGSNGTCDLGGFSGVATFCYLGVLSTPKTIGYIGFEVVTPAVGTQECEVGLYSSPGFPDVLGQTLTRISAGAVTDDITAGPAGFVNATAFTTEVAAGTHIWGALRVKMTGPGADDPVVVACGNDLGNGLCCVGTTAQALTHSSNATIAVTPQGPAGNGHGPGAFIAAFINA